MFNTFFSLNQAWSRFTGRSGMGEFLKKNRSHCSRLDLISAWLSEKGSLPRLHQKRGVIAPGVSRSGGG